MWKRAVLTAALTVMLTCLATPAWGQQTAKFDHRTKDNADLYDAVANTDVPDRHKVIPWVVGILCGSLILGMGLKHSFRNRFEG